MTTANEVKEKLQKLQHELEEKDAALWKMAGELAKGCDERYERIDKRCRACKQMNRKRTEEMRAAGFAIALTTVAVLAMCTATTMCGRSLRRRKGIEE